MMICRIDHSQEGLPEFLCRACHPELNASPVKLVAFDQARKATDEKIKQSNALREQQKQTQYEIWKQKQKGENVENLARKHLLLSQVKNGLRWDQRKAKWITDSTQPQEKNEMPRLTITPYGAEGQVIDRGRTSIKEGATQEQIDAQVQHAFIRGGIKRVTKIEVTKAGEIIHTRIITPEDVTSAGQQALAAEEKAKSTEAETNAATEGSDDMAKKKAKKAKAKGNGAVRRTRATVTMEMLARKSGVTIPELVKAFKEEFGDGKETTARIAITKVPKANKKKVVKEKSEARGTIYYLA